MDPTRLAAGPEIDEDALKNFEDKASEVSRLIKEMTEGKVKPEDIKVPWEKSEEEIRLEKQQAKAKAESKRQAQARLEIELAEKESTAWWSKAEAFQGMTRQEANQHAATMRSKNEQQTNAQASVRTITDDDGNVIFPRPKVVLKDRLDYSVWDKWIPDDPVSLEEMHRLKEQQDQEKLKAFEEANPDFCNQYVEDQEKRAKLKERKAETAEQLKLQGNRLFKKRDYDGALEKYREALKATPFDTSVLGNIAQVYIKFSGLGTKSHQDKQRYRGWAIEFCDRALFLDYDSVKALWRRSKVLVQQNKYQLALNDLTHALNVDPDNEELVAAKKRTIELLLESNFEQLVLAIEAGEHGPELASAKRVYDAMAKIASVQHGEVPPDNLKLLLEVVSDALGQDSTNATRYIMRRHPASLKALSQWLQAGDVLDQDITVQLLNVFADLCVELKSRRIVHEHGVFAHLLTAHNDVQGPRGEAILGLVLTCGNDTESLQWICTSAHLDRLLVWVKASKVEEPTVQPRANLPLLVQLVRVCFGSMVNAAKLAGAVEQLHHCPVATLTDVLLTMRSGHHDELIHETFTTLVQASQVEALRTRFMNPTFLELCEVVLMLPGWEVRLRQNPAASKARFVIRILCNLLVTVVEGVNVPLIQKLGANTALLGSLFSFVCDSDVPRDDVAVLGAQYDVCTLFYHFIKLDQTRKFFFESKANMASLGKVVRREQLAYKVWLSKDLQRGSAGNEQLAGRQDNRTLLITKLVHTVAILLKVELARPGEAMDAFAASGGVRSIAKVVHEEGVLAASVVNEAIRRGADFGVVATQFLITLLSTPEMARTYLFSAIESEKCIESLVSLLSNCHDGKVRKNAAVLLAKLYKADEKRFGDEIRRLRGMEMIVELGSRLV